MDNISDFITVTEYKSIGETIHHICLPNGLNINVLEKPEFNSSYAVLAVDYGGAHRNFILDGAETDTPAGVAHFLEHKMFDLPNGDNALELLSANGADPNAFTSSSMTAYYFSCTEKFEENLRLLLHFVTTPYFTEETVKKEQGIIAQEIRMGEDNPGVKIYYDLLEMLYPKHTLKDRVAGTVESIGTITAQTLYDCHRAFYVPDNMCLCVMGNVNARRVVELAAETLPMDAPGSAMVSFDGISEDEPAEKRRLRKMPVSAPQVLIGSKFAPTDSDQNRLYERLCAQLSLRMLVGSASPFYTRLYAEGLLNHDFDYEVDFFANTATVIIGGETQNPEKLFGEFCAELERVKDEGFDSEAFELAKRASLGARLRGLEDFENVCISLVEGQFGCFDALSAIPMLSEIRVEDCNRFIRRVFRAENFVMSVIEPGGGADE